MGYSVRTLGWRYTAWVPFSNGLADWEGKPLAAELYRHDGASHLLHPTGCQTDFDDCEVVNMAGEARVMELQQRLAMMLQAKFAASGLALRSSPSSPPSIRKIGT